VARKLKQSGRSIIVYDDCCVDQINPEMFDAEFWQESQIVPGYSGGRGATLYIRNAGDDWVLKHYHRGGLIGRLLNDGFLWFGNDSARSVVEFDLLREIVAAGLPGPVPVAAHVRRNGLQYSADLITRRIPDVVPFSTRLAEGQAPASVWERVGQCIGKFHASGFNHADLSTHNLQIDAQDNVYLLDWDRGRNMAPGNWRQSNLERLHRSCMKISREDSAIFSPADWDALLAGYRS
jgi:3-deoxy-D-manno-octulosonic acid kinase